MSSICLCFVDGSLEGCMHRIDQLLVLTAALGRLWQSQQACCTSRTAYKERNKAYHNTKKLHTKAFVRHSRTQASLQVYICAFKPACLIV